MDKETYLIKIRKKNGELLTVITLFADGKDGIIGHKGDYIFESINHKKYIEEMKKYSE